MEQPPHVFSTSLASIVPHEWIYASFSFDRHTSNVRMYVNDRELLNTNNATIGDHTSYNEFFVGTNSTQTSNLDGSISTMDLYNTDIYYKHIPNHIANDTNYLNNVKGFWKLTSADLSPNFFLDVSGNSNDLGIQGVEYTDSFPSVGSKTSKTPLFDGDVANYLSSDMEQVNTDSFSIATWFNPSDLREDQWVLSKLGNFGLTMDIFGLPILQIENTRTSTYSFRRTDTDDDFVVPLINYRLEQQAHPELTYTSIESTLEPAFQSESSQVVTVASFSEEDSGIVFALPSTTTGGNEYTNYTMGVRMRLDDDVNVGENYTLFSVHSKFTWSVQPTSGNKIKMCVHVW